MENDRGFICSNLRIFILLFILSTYSCSMIQTCFFSKNHYDIFIIPFCSFQPHLFGLLSYLSRTKSGNLCLYNKYFTIVRWKGFRLHLVVFLYYRRWWTFHYACWLIFFAILKCYINISVDNIILWPRRNKITFRVFKFLIISFIAACAKKRQIKLNLCWFHRLINIINTLSNS